MKRSRLPALLLMSGFLSLGALEAAAATRFVRSTDGVDAGNTCLVETSPCQTVQHGTDAASAGDEIWRAGALQSARVERIRFADILIVRFHFEI